MERPPWEEKDDHPPQKKPATSQKVTKRQANQHRPAANGGPNKRERIKTLIATGAGGHDWAVSSENKTDRIEAHPCLGREQPVPEGVGVHPSHHMANVGRAWICKRCFIHLWVSYVKIPPGVTTQCRPSRKEARAGGGQLAPFLPAEHRPSWLQSEQQPGKVPPRTKNSGRAKVEQTPNDPPKLHRFFAKPPPPLPAALSPPQDLGSREAGSTQQHNQPQTSQPPAQPYSSAPVSRQGKVPKVLQAGCSPGPALRSPSAPLPKGSKPGARRDEGTSPIARFFAPWPGTGNGSGVTTPKSGAGGGSGNQTTRNGGALTHILAVHVPRHAPKSTLATIKVGRHGGPRKHVGKEACTRRWCAVVGVLTGRDKELEESCSFCITPAPAFLSSTMKRQRSELQSLNTALLSSASVTQSSLHCTSGLAAE